MSSKRASRRFGRWSRYAAPAAFLVAATIAVLLVRSALQGSPAPPPPTVVVTTTAPATTEVTTVRTTTTSARRRFYTVVAGDTFGVIAAKTKTTVQQLELLNPGVSSTSLHIGQRLRVA